LSPIATIYPSLILAASAASPSLRRIASAHPRRLGICDELVKDDSMGAVSTACEVFKALLFFRERPDLGTRAGL
jgi:hypothetical protein